MSKRKKRKSSGLTGLLVVLILLLIGASGLMVWLFLNIPQDTPPAAMQQTTAATEPQAAPTTEYTEPETETTEPETEPPTTAPPEPEHVIATATIGATGDILMHLPVVNTGLQSDGSYDFYKIFQYLKPYSEGVDYAVANLETTLCGTDNGYPYHGYPNFNCPDAIVDSAGAAGFDMLLTANNHCYDTGMVGYTRTIEVIESRGLDYLGTRAEPDGPKWHIEDINGIRVGMLCYTYETPVPENGYRGRIYLNGLAMAEGGEQLINSFLPTRLDPFYAEVEQYLAEMKEAGAEATVMFIHWGEEYVLNTIPYQNTVAQGLCDLGIDVIVGGHPHVVEPMALLTSNQDPNHKTVCLYSMGNAVSNQRQGNLSMISTAHTEDGVWFTFTFCKYSDGTVYLDNVDLMPCWVDMRSTGAREYDIIPLDRDRTEEWRTLFELSEVGNNAATRSYDRTMAIVGPGLEESQAYLTQAREERDAGYLAAVQALIQGG